MRHLLLILGLSTVLLWQGTAVADRASARNWVERGRAEQAEGRTARALWAYEQAVAADPDYRPAHESAAPLWFARRKYAVVIRHFERLTLRDPDYAFGWYTLGYAYRLSGRAASAIAAYEMYIGLRPREAAPQYGLAMAHRAAGHPAEALAALERYVALERDPARARFVARARSAIVELGGASHPQPRGLAGVDATGGVGSAARGVTPASPDEPLALARARALLAQRRYSSALSVITRFAPTSASDTRTSVLLRAEILLGQGRRERAHHLLEAAVARTPTDGVLWRRLLEVAAAGRAAGQ